MNDFSEFLAQASMKHILGPLLIAVNLIKWWVKYYELIVIHVNNEYYIWTLTKPILNGSHFIDLFLMDIIAWGLLLYNINAIINICMQ